VAGREHTHCQCAHVWLRGARSAAQRRRALAHAAPRHASTRTWVWQRLGQLCCRHWVLCGDGLLRQRGELLQTLVVRALEVANDEQAAARARSAGASGRASICVCACLCACVAAAHGGRGGCAREARGRCAAQLHACCCVVLLTLMLWWWWWCFGRRDAVLGVVAAARENV
jgi:hypothetical protein